MSAFITLMLVFSLCSGFTNAQNSPQDYLDPHNAARAEVGVGPLEWDDSLEGYAQWYANERSGDCQLVHSGGQFGENLFWGGAGFDWTAAHAVGLWVDEKQYYDYGSNSCVDGQMCGHYTQVVWRDTTHVGCARVDCSNDGGVFTICSYNPPGNVEGQWPFSIPAKQVAGAHSSS